MIFAGSCQQENLEPAVSETTVTYTVELPDVQTKAIGDASTVDQLIYEVWKTEAADERDLMDDTKAIRLYQENTALIERNGKTCAVITLNLVQDQEYTILFWAQKKNTGVYNTDYLTDVYYAKSPKTELFSNQEDYAAFYATDFVSDSDPKSKTVVLKRPFAQLNLATKNTADEYGVVVESSKVIVTKVGSHFNVATNIAETPGKPGVNSVTEPLEFVFNTETDPSGEDEYITVNGQQYEYVAMNYMFATGDNVTVQYEINTTLTGTNGQTTTAKITNEVINVPLKENYRTNIVGNLLTSTTDYEVVIDASWDDQGDGTLVEVWDSKYAQVPYFNAEANQYEISLASELVWLAHKVNGTLENPEAETKTVVYYEPETFEGQTFVLKENIDLKNVLWTPIGATGKFMGTFDGNAKTIKNLNVKVTDKTPAGLFANAKYVKNVTVENAVVEGHYKVGVIVGDGLCSRIKDCHVKNATVTATTLNNDEANNVGGIVGYLSAENEAYVVGSTVENATIKGYRDVGGIAGTANCGAEVSGNTVKNVTVIADQTPAYIEPKVANVGTIVGRDNDKKTVMENNTVENSTAVVLINTASNLEYQANNNPGSIEIVFASDITGNATILQQEGHNVIINGNEKKYDGIITVNGNARANGAETLTFKNINFETRGNDFTFISAPSKINEKYNYTHNVTIEGCTFTGNQTVGSASFTGTYNFNMKDCEATNMHSILQIQSCDNNVVVDGVKVNNCKSGISLGNIADGSIKNATISATGYGVRLDGAKERTVSVSIEKSSIEAYIPVTVRKMNNDACSVNVTIDEETTLTGKVYDVAVCSNEYENGVKPVFPVGIYNLTGTDNFDVYPVASKESLTAAINNTALAEIDIEGDIENIGLGFEVKRDVVFNFNNQELNAGSTANSYWYAIEAYGDHNVTINDANFTRAGVYAANDANVVFNNGIINHKPERTSRYIFCAQNGATITINEGTFYNDRTANSYFWADNATIYVKGGNFGGSASNKKVVLTNGGQVIISGGTFNFDPTAYLEEGYTATQNGSSWVVSATNLITNAASFEAALASGNDGDILILAPGTYNGTFAVKRNNITIKGLDGAVVDCINLNGSQNVTIKNVQFDAAGAQWAYNGSGNKVQPANIITGDNANNPIIGAHNVVIEGCHFTGTYVDGGGAVSFTDAKRTSGGSGDITVKNCTFDTKGGYFDIYAFYSGDNKSFVIEGNTLKSSVYNPIYLGQYQSSVPVVVKNNNFMNAANIEAAVYLQAHSSGEYTVSVDDSGNTFAE